MRVRLVRLLITLPFALCPMALPPHALALDANLGWSTLTYVCPSPLEIDLSWTAANNATFYSLQLMAPVDPTLNGGIGGTYLRQFGSIEVAKGQITSAAVSLAQASLPGATALQWEVMLGGPHGYADFVPGQQVAIVPVPCGQTTPKSSSPV